MSAEHEIFYMRFIGVKIAIFSVAAVLPMVLVHASNPAVAGDDPCFIHSGCKKGVGYSQKGSMGPGWYCTDGQEVNKQSNFDDCNIASGCSSDTRCVKYGPVWKGQPHSFPRVTGKSWQCYDNAFIHQGCTKGAVYVKNGTMGSAWYCNDGKKVEESTQIDEAFITPGCSEGAIFDSNINAWRCNS